MKSIFLIVFILFVSDVFSQYPDWMPEELRNRIFCGDLKTSGRDLYGNSTYITIPYEILVTESGIQMRMNPREQFGEDKWGETIKVKYDLGTVIEDKDYYQKRIKLSLSSDNEAPDSPIYPDYKLESVQINLCTYQDGMVLSRDELRRFQMYKKNRPLPSNIACCIKVPYYTSTCGTARNNYVGSNSCKEILTPAQIIEEERLAEERRLEEERLAEERRLEEERLKRLSDSLSLKTTAKNIVDDYLSARGGIELLSGIKTIYAKANGTSEKFTFTFTRKDMYPNKRFTSFDFDFGASVINVFNGKSGYRIQNGSTVKYTDSEIKEAKSVKNLFEEIDFNVDDMKLLGVFSINGVDAAKIQVNNEMDYFRYYDIKTNLLIRKEKTVIEKNEKTTQTADYYDYRKVNGVLMPFKIVVSFGAGIFEFNYSEYKINEGVSKKDFN